MLVLFSVTNLIYTQASTQPVPKEVDDIAQAPRDLVQTVKANPDFATLMTALRAADLNGALSTAGPFTIFAPTNEAFKGLTGLEDMLKSENKERLASLLKAHIVAGAITANDLRDGQTLTTLDGEPLVVSVMNNKIRINGAEIAQPDILATNGVLHAIKDVILPGANMGNK